MGDTCESAVTRPARLMVEPVAVTVFRDVTVDQPHFVPIGSSIALGDRSLAVAERLHLGPAELDPSFEAVLHEIVEPRAPVFGHDFLLVERLG